MAVTDLTTLFSDIADAIRGKDGTSSAIVAEDFPTRISAIPSGGGGGPVNVTITGVIDYLNYKGVWDGVLSPSNTDISVTISNATSAEHAFEDSNLLVLPSMSFDNNTITNVDTMFSGCKNVRTISGLSSVATSTSSQCLPRAVFRYCYSLREIPFKISSGNNVTSNTAMQNMFQNCYTLNEIVGLGVPYGRAWTSNAFSGTFGSCYRIKRATFDTNNGTPYTTQWKSQTIDLSSYVGFAQNESNITNYNSGITTAKKVTDATSYTALKNDPDWYTQDVAYSRYNHDSAVETINTLPDTSAYLATAGGTNTIKFKGAAGSATDGGAINTLTSAEIAVATAKGWTVSLV